MIEQHREGLFAAVCSPMRADGEIHLDAIERYAAMLAASGVRGAFVCGTTGESMSLSVGERMQIAERWGAVAGDALEVLVHVGHDSLPASRALAEHAQKIGAQAVAALAPGFFKPACVEDLVAFCAQVAAAAPELPFYYYHIPDMTGVRFPAAEVLAVAVDGVPTLAGAKFTGDDMMDFGQCLALEGGRLDVLFGRDENLLAALALGGQAAIGAAYNFAAPLYRELLERWQRADLDGAQVRQAQGRDLAAVLSGFGFLPACKAAMQLVGMDCGPVRPPLRTLSPEQVETLRAELELIGFFGYASRPQ